MMKRQASNASPRCALVIHRVGELRPTDQIVLVVNVEARFRFDDDRFERLVRHSGIVLERHLRNTRIVVDVADRTDEGHDSTHPRVACPQRRELLRDVEIRRLNAYGHREPYPPVTGGSKATSSPCEMHDSRETIAWLTATRTARP